MAGGSNAQVYIRAAVESVIPGAAEDSVCSTFAEGGVIALARDNQIVSRPSTDDVIPAETDNDVVSSQCQDHVRALSAVNQVAFVGTEDRWRTSFTRCSGCGSWSWSGYW